MIKNLRRSGAAAVRRAFAAVGLEVSRRHDPDDPRHSAFARRRRRLLEDHAVDLVLDIGASRGFYGLALRVTGYDGAIMSFEPLADSFAALEERARADARWTAQRLALGDHEGDSMIHVAANADSSSLLPMADRHLQAAPYAGYIQDETVRLARVDVVAADAVAHARSVHLKMDVQGYEDRVLRGAEGIMDKVVLIETELSLCLLYDEQLLCRDMLGLLGGLGFELVCVEDAFVDPATGRTLQIDGIFARAQ